LGRKKKSIAALADGIAKFESGRNVAKQADYSDLKTFLSVYLNTPEPKQRKRLAEEFRKRHLELYQFLKENPQLLSAETDMAAMIQAAVSVSKEETEDKQMTNLFEKLEAGLK